MARRHVTIEEEKAQIEPFSGDDSVGVEQWIENLLLSITSLGALPPGFLRLGRIMLSGSAKIRAHGQQFIGWLAFSQALTKEFHRNITMSYVYE